MSVLIGSEDGAGRARIVRKPRGGLDAVYFASSHGVKEVNYRERNDGRAMFQERRRNFSGTQIWEDVHHRSVCDHARWKRLPSFGNSRRTKRAFE